MHAFQHGNFRFNELYLKYAQFFMSYIKGKHVIDVRHARYPILISFESSINSFDVNHIDF